MNSNTKCSLHKTCKKFSCNGCKFYAQSKYDLSEYKKTIEKSEKIARLIDINYIFDFGKYKGESLKQVFSQNSKYISWCLKNKIFTIQTETIDKLVKMNKSTPTNFKYVEPNIFIEECGNIPY